MPNKEHLEELIPQASQRALDVSTEGYEEWDATQLAAYFKQVGLGDYSEMLMMHKITGKLAPLLTDEDMREMGINIVGDRLRFRQYLQALKSQARHKSRTKVIWEGKERLYFSNFNKLMLTCCGTCPEDPSIYTLTTKHLKVKHVDPLRCGPVKCCCCYDYSVNNIDLSKIDDVNMIGIPPPCCLRTFCCAPGKEVVEIKTTGEAENAVLNLKKGQGSGVAEKILLQVEAAQAMERS